MIVFQNRAIRASAGTGKTFRLAHRYIGLMATGVQPERICALTFSRKAAGEIFDKIVEHLCGAATDEKKRARTAGAILKEKLCVPQDTPESYRNLLRELLNQGHRLRIGTLDSFILGIVRAFPMELGIPPETQPVNGDGGEALAMRLSILTRLFDPSRANGPDGRNEGDMFLRDFRQACFGQVTKSLVARLDRLISDFYGFYRQHSKADCHWGVIDRIWEPAERWWEDPELRSVVIPADLPVRLAGAFGAADSKGNLGKACAAIAAAAMAHSADRSWPDLNETILSRLLQYAAQSSPPAINYSRKDYSVPAVLWPPLRRALGNLIGVEVARALERTKGQRAVLDRYDRLYSGALGTDGRFTFEDLSRILGADGLRPSRKQSESNRLFIDYRLDGMLDHWLLDEFQDTSNTQWSALGNLIDEVIQGSGRSFFYVGDVKQSIYGWRGGNHRLFGAVLENYKNADERAITTESINACHRSLPAIIDTVNMVFENLAGWEPDIAGDQRLRKDAIDAFSGAWEKHVSARLGEGEGFASLLEYEPKKKTAKPDGAGEGDGGEEEYSDDPAQFEAVAEVLKQVQPTKRSITVAVLVGTNEDGRACVDVLRRQLSEVPVVHEGTGGIVDNPVVCLLLALVRYAAHPGDTVARLHLQMSPLARHLKEARNLDELPVMVLSSVHERGFAGTLREWGTLLDELDAFGRQRLRELLAAAEEFDASGVRDADTFASYINAYKVNAGAAAGTVRVMTVHQAKGLGFDLVIVPFASAAKSFGRPRETKFLAGQDWVLSQPNGLVMAGAAGRPLAALDACRSEENFGQLCVLYVALTRASDALYMIIPTKPAKRSVVRPADLLCDRLAMDGAKGAGPGGLPQLFAAGDSEWYKKPRKKDNQGDKTPQSAQVKVALAAEVTRREPSKEHTEGRAFPAQWLFKTDAGDVRDFGSAIHRLFEKIEWIEGVDVERVVAAWRAESPEPAVFLADVERQFRACLANAEVRRKLSKPASAGQAEVWREASFNLVLESEGERYLVSGRFDRLVVERDGAGKPVHATVFDFKSNRVEKEADLSEAADGYASQMADYACAAARLLSLPVGQVTTVLLFTRTSWMKVG